MSADLGFVIARCDGCGPVPVEVERFEIHADDAGRIRLYAFRCPACDELGSGGDPALLDALLDAGTPRRRLRALDEDGGTTPPAGDGQADTGETRGTPGR